jgi:spore maturation protein CgeB
VAFDPVGPQHVNRPGLRVAAVTDEMSYRCWQYEAELFTFSPERWREELSQKPPDLLFVESAWRGMGGRWADHLVDVPRGRPRQRETLDELLMWCRRHGIPSVFHSKEDPIDLELFLGAARGFDFVFTTDQASVSRYERELGHSRIAVLPFAAQPRLHNPAPGPLPRTRNVNFAGAWYAERHPQRRSHGHHLLAPALEFGLDIFDRVGSDDASYHWPQPYVSALRGSLPYARMVAANKCYRAGINLNTVVDSPTMLSRRVFELLASGTAVVSSPARAISELLGPDLVSISEDADTTRSHLRKLLYDESYRQAVTVRGVRRVLLEHTYSHRMNRILEHVGLDFRARIPSWTSCVQCRTRPPHKWRSSSSRTRRIQERASSSFAREAERQSPLRRVPRSASRSVALGAGFWHRQQGAHKRGG